MDFKALQSMGAQRTQLSAAKHGQSEQALIDGFQFFDQAEASGFSEITFLQEACASFIAAMKSNRADTRPYNALAYIFLILQDYQTALSYLQGALELEAQNETALQIRQEIQKAVNERSHKEPQPVAISPDNDGTLALPNPLPDSAEDFDTLYDQTERWIFDRVKKIMLSPALPGLLKNTREFEHCTQERAALRQEYEILKQVIEILAEDLEVQDLLKIARPLEQNIHRHQRVLENSQTYLQCLEKVQQEIEMLKQVSGEATEIESKEDLDILEENLEIILENYDDFGAQLETLQAKKLSVGQLADAYQTLYQAIEKYQDILDDVSNRFT